MGDMLLMALSKRLRALLRDSDDLYRIGGDEFVILLSHSIGKIEIAAVSRRILSSLKEPFHLHQKTISVGASIGIAIYPENASNEGELLRHADLAMYNAKQTGRNRFVFFSDLSTETSRKKPEKDSPDNPR
jgi:diguanylate cyclase (GGDEF)-like protein